MCLLFVDIFSRELSTPQPQGSSAQLRAMFRQEWKPCGSRVGRYARVHARVHTYMREVQVQVDVQVRVEVEGMCGCG